MDIKDCDYEREDCEIVHTKGKKDNFMVQVRPEGNSWNPSNKALFALNYMHLVSEQYEYSHNSCYGARMPWFFKSLAILGSEGYNTAKVAHRLEGEELVGYFEACVQEHADELIEELEELKEEAG